VHEDGRKALAGHRLRERVPEQLVFDTKAGRQVADGGVNRALGAGDRLEWG